VIKPGLSWTIALGDLESNRSEGELLKEAGVVCCWGKFTLKHDKAKLIQGREPSLRGKTNQIETDWPGIPSPKSARLENFKKNKRAKKRNPF